MKRIAFVIAIFALVVGASSSVRPQKSKAIDKSGKARQVEKIPEGVTVQGNRVTLKKGFKFVRTSKNSVSIARIKTGGIGGGFNCDCNKDGGCSLIITGTTASCTSGNCTGSCVLEIIIIGPKNLSDANCALQQSGRRLSKAEYGAF